jgi:hypothetical protein
VDAIRTLYVTVPEFEARYQIAKKSKKSGRPRFWTVNGQGLYNATLYWRARSAITNYFHNYLTKYISKQISKTDIKYINDYVFPGSVDKLSISLDIYEIKRGKMPDVGNLWLWTKWFEDALQLSGIIPDDNPDYVIESGRTRYHFVDDPEKRVLVFTIRIITTN